MPWPELAVAALGNCLIIKDDDDGLKLETMACLGASPSGEQAAA
jgi:hypothetical protein